MVYYSINVEDDIMAAVERAKNFIIRSSNGILDKNLPLRILIIQEYHL